MVRIKKSVAIVVMLMMVVSIVMGTAVNAVDPSAYSNTVITETAKTFDIERKVTDVTNPVTNTFTYTIVEDTTDNPKDNSGNIVHATGFPTTATIAFNAVAPDTNNVASQKQVVDFSTVQFPKVGVYRFKITETGSTDTRMYPIDSDQIYYVTVVATNLDSSGNDNTGTQPSGNMKVTLLTSGTGSNIVEGLDGAINAASKSDIIFTETVETTEIDISKTVTGTGADMDKYFQFTVTLPGDANCKYPITGDFSLDGVDKATGNTNKLQGGTNTIYLKHGQTAKVSKLPIQEDYTVVEKAETNYTTYVDGSTTAGLTSGTKNTKPVPVQPQQADFDTDGTAGLSATEQAAYDAAVSAYNTAVSEFNTNNKTSFVNNKEQATLTGIFIDILPFIVLLGLAAFGMYAIRKTSNKD